MPDSKIITWFDIPARDINRAVGFQNAVLGTNLQVMDFNGIEMAIFNDIWKTYNFHNYQCNFIFVLIVYYF